MKAKSSSLHSRAAKRATSPSINTDKSLKSVNLPIEERQSSRPSALAARHDAGIRKKPKGRSLSTKARKRQEKGLDKAEAVMDKTEKKIAKSVGKGRVIKSRANDWDALNKIAMSFDKFPKEYISDTITKGVAIAEHVDIVNFHETHELLQRAVIDDD
ncbi:MAG: hypothetical protein M1829_004227 [Trizodia sp. TS-e1964]|nr:MAG: hypothetical protein M1829_004227 [Trizodia sp. TS-e1964]